MIKIVDTEREAEKVVNFLSSKQAFGLEMNEFRRKARHDAVFNSLSEVHHKYWFIDNERGEVIGAL